MSEMHLKHLERAAKIPAFTYNTCGKITKDKERIQKLKGTGDSSYIFWNKLDKAYFQDDMPYGDFKDLPRRTATVKVLRDKEFNIPKNSKYYGCQQSVASLFLIFFDRKTAA